MHRNPISGIFQRYNNAAKKSNDKMPVFWPPGESSKITTTKNCCWKEKWKGEEEGKTEEIMDWRGAQINVGGPESCRKQVYVAKNTTGGAVTSRCQEVKSDWKCPVTLPD